MQIKTILNQIAKNQSFVYESEKVIQNGEQKELHVTIRPRRNSRPVCSGCPWAKGKSPITTAYGWFPVRWARRMSWSEVASAFHTSWHTVFSAVEMAVTWGRAHMNLDGITAIGVDEMQWGQGHRYITVIYQINEGAKRLLWVGEKRKAKTLLKEQFQLFWGYISPYWAGVFLDK